MEKHVLLAAVLLVVGLATVVVGKVIGPRLLDWLLPSFNKATNRIDDTVMGKPGDWEAKVREIVEMSPEQLQQQVDEIASRFATPAPVGQPTSTPLLPRSPRVFFDRYRGLSFDGETKILDSAEFRTVADKQRKYLIIGRTEDDGQFYAVDLQDKRSIVRVDVDKAGNVFNVEEDAPSFEHFLVLQHQLYLKST